MWYINMTSLDSPQKILQQNKHISYRFLWSHSLCSCCVAQTANQSKKRPKQMTALTHPDTQCFPNVPSVSPMNTIFTPIRKRATIQDNGSAVPRVMRATKRHIHRIHELPSKNKRHDTHTHTHMWCLIFFVFPRKGLSKLSKTFTSTLIRLFCDLPFDSHTQHIIPGLS